MNIKKEPPFNRAAQQEDAKAPESSLNEAPRRPVRASRPQRRARPTRPTPLYDSIESAAAKLGLDVEALRARCRRAAVRVGDSVQAHLGGGIVAFKFGRSWRVIFPSA